MCKTHLKFLKTWNPEQEKGKMTDKKKVWEMPQLIVLTRGKLSESVLLSCGYIQKNGQVQNKSGVIQ